MATYWFVLLLWSICFEGLGRKYLPSIPSAILYFFKDIVLLAGVLVFRPDFRVRRTAEHLFRGFKPVVKFTVMWTVVEAFNAALQSFPLAIVGIRAYWLWWLAPVLIAGVFQRAKVKDAAIYALILVALGISVLAAVQFASPPDSLLNVSPTTDPDTVADTIIVGSTGRVRVSSTFSFLSGFSDFIVLVPTLLLSIGLEAKAPRLRRLALVATFATASVAPMSGSRTTVVLGGAVLILTVWAAGLFVTRIGRRVIVGAVAAAVLATVAFPDALLGVQSRFEDESETSGRFTEALKVLPPVALATVEYPLLGLGTGMQQNVRISMGISTSYEEEGEIGRYLVEQGPIGFLAIWITRLGLVVALLRSYKILKAAGKRGAAGAALSYAAVSFFGNLVFDHVWQALYFIGCAFILSEVTTVLNAQGEGAEMTKTPIALPR